MKNKKVLELEEEIKKASGERLMKIATGEIVEVSRGEYERTRWELEHLRAIKKDYDELFELFRLKKYYGRMQKDNVRVQEIKSNIDDRYYVQIMVEISKDFYIF